MHGHSRYINVATVNHVTLQFDSAFIASRLGLVVSESEILRILGVLEFSPVVSDGVFTVTVPSHRVAKDVSILEDIVEEIGRIIGYDAIEEAAIPGVFHITRANAALQSVRLVQNYLQGQGLSEVYNYSFSNAAKDESVGHMDHTNAIGVRNAVSEDFTLMRRSLAPLLMANIRENLKKTPSIGFFEIAKVHSKSSVGFHESKSLGIILSHTSIDDARKMFDGLMEVLEVAPLIISPAIAPYFHPQASGQYLLEDQVIAEFGRVHPTVARTHELPVECVYMELSLDTVLAQRTAGESHYTEPTKFPKVARELNFLLPERTPANTLSSFILSTDARI